MQLEPTVDTIRTARLELVALSTSFVESVKRGDLPAASREVGASVSPWLAENSAHLVQLQLAQAAADAEGADPLGRVIVVDAPTGRRVIGSIGFHGLPDDRARLEVGCSIDPADQGEGFAAEALTALVEWAAERYGISRVVIAIPVRRDRRDAVPIEIKSGATTRIGTGGRHDA